MLKLPATFDRFSSRADGSFGLGFSTQEADLDMLAQLQSHVRGFGWLLFSEEEIADEDIPDDAPKRDDISPSERLRKVMYAFYMKQKEAGKTDETFSLWREKQMDRIIERYKSLLD